MLQAVSEKLAKLQKLTVSSDIFHFTEETIRVLKLSLTEFSLPKFYTLYGISKVKSAAVSAFRSTFRTGDRSFTYQHAEQERMSLGHLEIVTDALLEIMEVGQYDFLVSSA
jgi:neurofibromin 1